GGKEIDRQRAKLARQVLIYTSEIVRSKRRCPIGDHGLRFGKAADFRARSIYLDVQVGRTVVGIAKPENVLASTAVGMPADGVGRGGLGGLGDRQGKGRERPPDVDPF